MAQTYRVTGSASNREERTASGRWQPQVVGRDEAFADLRAVELPVSLPEVIDGEREEIEPLAGAAGPSIIREVMAPTQRR